MAPSGSVLKPNFLKLEGCHYTTRNTKNPKTDFLTPLHKKACNSETNPNKVGPFQIHVHIFFVENLFASEGQLPLLAMPMIWNYPLFFGYKDSTDDIDLFDLTLVKKYDEIIINLKEILKDKI